MTEGLSEDGFARQPTRRRAKSVEIARTFAVLSDPARSGVTRHTVRRRASQNRISTLRSASPSTPTTPRDAPSRTRRSRRAGFSSRVCCPRSWRGPVPVRCRSLELPRSPIPQAWLHTAEPRGALEGMSHLQHPQVIPMGADDLQPHRSAISGEPTGDREGR